MKEKPKQPEDSGLVACTGLEQLTKEEINQIMEMQITGPRHLLMYD